MHPGSIYPGSLALLAPRNDEKLRPLGDKQAFAEAESESAPAPAGASVAFTLGCHLRQHRAQEGLHIVVVARAQLLNSMCL